MPDTEPSVSFLPASPATRVQQPVEQPSLPVPDAPAPVPAVSAEPTIQRAPTKQQPRQQQVTKPNEDLPVDPGTGYTYRPFTIGGLMVRCASVVPADTMLDVVSKQQKLSEKNMEDLTTEEQIGMLHLIGQMLGGVVWPEDSDMLRARLRDPRDPISISELATAVQALWGEYNEATRVGKEQ